MKKLNTILTLFLLCVTMSFSEVNDNIDVNKSGQGSFGATIILPLTISDAGYAFLGVFVKSDIAYNADNGDIFESSFLEFIIEGEAGQPLLITIDPVLSNSYADIKIRTTSFFGSDDAPTPEIGTGGIDITAITPFHAELVSLADPTEPNKGTFFLTLECYEVKAKESNGDNECNFTQTVTVAYPGL